MKTLDNEPTSETGTVTSVALTMPSQFGVTGSPVVDDGTLAVTLTSSTGNGDVVLATSPTITDLIAAGLTIPSGSGFQFFNGANSTTLGTLASSNYTFLLPPNMGTSGQVLTTNGGIDTGWTSIVAKGFFVPTWESGGTPVYGGSIFGEIARVGRLVTILLEINVSVTGAPVNTPATFGGLPSSGELNCTNPYTAWQRLGLISGNVTTPAQDGPYNLTIRNNETLMYLKNSEDNDVNTDGSGNFVATLWGVMSYIGPDT